MMGTAPSREHRRGGEIPFPLPTLFDSQLTNYFRRPCIQEMTPNAVDALKVDSHAVDTSKQVRCNCVVFTSCCAALTNQATNH